MKGFITIGKLAKLGGVTAKTLKHYEKLDLIKPDYIDPLTHYRYYSADQVKKIYEILSLKGLGLSLTDIQSTCHKDRLKEKLIEVREETEKKIEELQELLITVNKKLESFQVEVEEDFKIEYLHLEERKLYIYPFEPIEEIDSPTLYIRALEMEKRLPMKREPFRGAVLDVEFFRRGRYRCLALFQKLKDYSNLSREEILILPAGIYLSLWFRGSTVEKNDMVMEKAMEYIVRHNLQLEGRVIGFAHRGAHTRDKLHEYESEIQLLLK